MAKYILTDYAGCEDGYATIKVFGNKDDLIEQLMGYLDDDIILEVKK